MSYLYLCSPVDCRWMGGVGDVGGMNNKTISLTMQGCMLFQYGPLSVYLYVCMYVCMYVWMDGWMQLLHMAPARQVSMCTAICSSRACFCVRT